MENLSKKPQIPEAYKKETFGKLLEILISRDEWIKEGIKNGRVITEDTRFSEDLSMNDFEKEGYASDIMNKWGYLNISEDNIKNFKSFQDYISYIFLEDCLNSKR